MSDSGLLGVLRKVPVHVALWFLLTSLVAVLIYFGGAVAKTYESRVGDLEKHKKDQNGHLHNLDLRMERIETNVQWIKEKLEDK